MARLYHTDRANRLSTRRNGLGSLSPRSVAPGLGSAEPRTYDAWRKWCTDNHGTPWEVPCGNWGAIGSKRGKLACRVDPLRLSLAATSRPVRCNGLDYYVAPDPVQATWHDRKKGVKDDSGQQPATPGATGWLANVENTTKYAAIAVVALAAIYLLPRGR